MIYQEFKTLVIVIITITAIVKNKKHLQTPSSPSFTFSTLSSAGELLSCKDVLCKNMFTIYRLQGVPNESPFWSFLIAYHVFQFGNLLNIVCGDDGNNQIDTYFKHNPRELDRPGCNRQYFLGNVILKKHQRRDCAKVYHKYFHSILLIFRWEIIK